MTALYHFLAWVTLVGLLILTIRLIPVVFQLLAWLVSTTAVIALVLTLVVLGLLWWYRD